MKLIEYKINKDIYGYEYTITFVKMKKHSALQVSLSTSIRPAYPYIQISMGQKSLLNIFIYCYKVGFEMSYFAANWHYGRDGHYKR